MKQTRNDHANRQTNYSVAHSSSLLLFLLENCMGKSRNNVKSMLSRGQVLVDGRTVTRFDHPLTTGQTVTVLMHITPTVQLPFEIMFEDHDLIVIDKPAGLLTIATDREKTKTAYHMLTEYVHSHNPEEGLHIVHRLDRDTSGVLLFAKSRELRLAFQDRWNELVKLRSYLAVVEGIPEKSSGTIRSFLHETAAHMVYSGRPAGGQQAVTHYTLLAQNGSHALVRVEIETGRKNQIRVHMRELGHPVVGDKKYGASTNPLGRLGLHADRLKITHPLTGTDFSFAAKTPAPMLRLFPGYRE